MASYDIPNPPQNLGLNVFRAVTNDYESIAKSCRFSVRIFKPVGLLSNSNSIPQDFTYLCEATELPGRAFTNVDVRYYGPNQKLPINSNYEDINMTFICRTQFPEREFFDDWMELINPTTTFDFNYRDNYSTTIEIFQHSEIADENGQMGTTYEFALFDAYPIMVNPQPVVWADDSIQRLVITFSYTKWRRNNKDNLKSIKRRSGAELAYSGPTPPRTENPQTQPPANIGTVPGTNALTDSFFGAP